MSTLAENLIRRKNVILDHELFVLAVSTLPPLDIKHLSESAFLQVQNLNNITEGSKVILVKHLEKVFGVAVGTTSSEKLQFLLNKHFEKNSLYFSSLAGSLTKYEQDGHVAPLNFKDFNLKLLWNSYQNKDNSIRKLAWDSKKKVLSSSHVTEFLGSPPSLNAATAHPSIVAGVEGQVLEHSFYELSMRNVSSLTESQLTTALKFEKAKSFMQKHHEVFILVVMMTVILMALVATFLVYYFTQKAN